MICSTIACADDSAARVATSMQPRLAEVFAGRR